MDATLYKLEIFVPESHFEPVCQALWASDAGHIGQYDHCLSWSKVNSCWRSLEGSHPVHGEIGSETWAEDYKVEVCCTAAQLKAVLCSVKEAHPYEEPVINVLPMAGSGL